MASGGFSELSGGTLASHVNCQNLLLLGLVSIPAMYSGGCLVEIGLLFVNQNVMFFC